MIADALVSALDYGHQRRLWKNRLRMTREEVRREMKETEGDPYVRGRQRQRVDGGHRTANHDERVVLLPVLPPHPWNGWNPYETRISCFFLKAFENNSKSAKTNLDVSLRNSLRSSLTCFISIFVIELIFSMFCLWS